MITALTPTGARPEAFAACVEQMRAQDHPGPVRWVIVDDGPEPEPRDRDWPEGWSIIVVRPKPVWEPGENTLARNLVAGLARCTQRVVIVEDDDCYATWWLRQCDAWLDTHDLVGEAPSLYRHRNGRERLMGNTDHASLCSTALRGPALDALRRSCEQGAKGIDLRLWRDFGGSKRLYPPQPRGVTGIKGYPGRPGLGVGHRL